MKKGNMSINYLTMGQDLLELMERLLQINKKLPSGEQLPQSLFYVLINATQLWDVMIENHMEIYSEEPDINLFELWKERSGYNDLHFITDKFKDQLTQDDYDVLDLFEAWALDIKMHIF